MSSQGDHHKANKGDWGEVGGTFLMWEFIGLEEAKGGFCRWRKGRVVERNYEKKTEPGHVTDSGFYCN